MNYARCIVCGHEYPSQLNLSLSLSCPGCGDSTRTLHPAEDVKVRAEWPPFDDILRDAAKWAKKLIDRDPALVAGPHVVAAVTRRLRLHIPLQNGPFPLRVNWGELNMLFRFAEQWAIDGMAAGRNDMRLLDSYISSARRIEAQRPDLRKLTGITAEAEAQVQEALKTKLDGVKFILPPPHTPGLN